MFFPLLISYFESLFAQRAFPGDVNICYAGSGRSALTGKYRLLDMLSLALKHCFNAAVMHISDPAVQLEHYCLILSERTITYSLNPSFNEKLRP